MSYYNMENISTSDKLDKINNWYKMMENVSELTFEEAKDLTKKLSAMPSGNDKNELRDRVINGTLVKVLDYIKRSDFLLLNSSHYDMDDVISAACEVWIEIIDDNRFENTNWYTHMFNSYFHQRISEKLGIISQGEMSKISLMTRDTFARVMSWLFEMNKSNNIISFDDFKEFVRNNRELEFYGITRYEGQLYTAYELMNEIYNSCFNSKDIEPDISINRLKFIQRMMVDSVVVGTFNDEVYNMSTEDVEDIVCKRDEENLFIDNVFNNSKLSELEKEVLLYRMGFFDGKAMPYRKVQQRLGLKSHETVRAAESKALKKIRKYSKKIISSS